jgi:hypothetical protein
MPPRQVANYCAVCIAEVETELLEEALADDG